MFFTAHIRPQSVIDRNWSQQSRISGVVHGVIFKRVQGKYVAEAMLSTAEVAALYAIPSVVIETIAAALPAAPSLPLPPRATKPAADIMPQEELVPAEATTDQGTAEPEAPKPPRKARNART